MAAFSWLLVTSTLSQLSLSQKYIFVDIVLTIDEAEAYCQTTYGTTLASIHSSIDQNDAVALCQPQPGDSHQSCAIGLNDRNNERYTDPTLWSWTDGAPFDYSNWLAGEPNDYTANGFPGEDCVVIQMDTDGTWNDCPCAGPVGHESAYYVRFLCNYGTYFPTSSPTLPTANPTPPSGAPTKNPTQNPTKNPTLNPSTNPTQNPIVTPNPSRNPTRNPSKNPSKNPTENPTQSPSKYPTLYPTINPSLYPFAAPTVRPNALPTSAPIDAPTDITGTTQNGGGGDLNNSQEKASFLPWADDLMLLLGSSIFVLIVCIFCMGCYYFISGRKHAKQMEAMDGTDCMDEGIGELETGAPLPPEIEIASVKSYSVTDDNMVLIRAKSEMNAVNNNNFASNQMMNMPNIMNPMNMNMNNMNMNNMNMNINMDNMNNMNNMNNMHAMNNNYNMNPMMNMYGMNMNMIQQNFGVQPNMAQFYMNQMNTEQIGVSGEEPGHDADHGQLQVNDANDANVANNNMPNLPPVPDAPDTLNDDDDDDDEEYDENNNKTPYGMPSLPAVPLYPSAETDESYDD